MLEFLLENPVVGGITILLWLGLVVYGLSALWFGLLKWHRVRVDRPDARRQL